MVRMKKLVWTVCMAVLLLAAGTSCRHSKTGEIVEIEAAISPESAIFQISRGKLIVNDSALSGIRTSLQDDALKVELFTDLEGTLPHEADIPAETKKLRLLGCDFDLPSPEHTAYFYSFFAPGYTSGIACAERGVIQGVMMLLSFAPDRRSFDPQIRYLRCSESEQWQKKENGSFIVAEDGQIFEWLGRSDRPGRAPIYFWLTEKFQNRGGKLHIHLSPAGRFSDFPLEKSCVLREIELPQPDPHPASIFFVNRQPREKYLAENQSRKFKVKKSVAEFRDFSEKLKRLRSGMTPKETAALLGKPDQYRVHGSDSRKNEARAFATYYFLKGGPDSVDDLEVTLSFVKDPSGVFRLEWVF